MAEHESSAFARSTPRSKHLRSKQGAVVVTVLSGLVLVAAVVYLVIAGNGEKSQSSVSALSKTDQPPARQTVQRSTALADDELLLPDEVESQPQTELEAQQPEEAARPVSRSIWNCQGEVRAEAALKVIHTHRQQVRTCYEQQLKVNAALQGTLQLKLRVAQGGTVTDVNVGGSLRDRQVHQCVQARAKHWQFDVPKGGSCAVIAAPFHLTPRDS